MRLLLLLLLLLLLFSRILRPKHSNSLSVETQLLSEFS